MLNRMFFAQNVSISIPITTGIWGRLYNSYAASDTLLPPTGWHIPSYSELYTLAYNLGNTEPLIGSNGKMDGVVYWNSSNTANNSSGFSAVGAGYRLQDGTFAGRFDDTHILSSSINVPNENLAIYFAAGDYEFNGVAQGSSPNIGASIRLIKNDSTDPLSVVDYDGNIYDTVKIVDQVWSKQNFKCTHLNNGTPIPNITSATAWAALTTGAMCAYNNDENNV